MSTGKNLEQDCKSEWEALRLYKTTVIHREQEKIMWVEF